MDIFMLVLVVLFVFCSGISLALGLSDDNVGKILFPITLLFALVSGVVLIQSEVKAIDVYRGKTELKITYQGNTPVDTVVVYKNN